MNNDAASSRKIILKSKNKLSSANEYEEKAKRLNSGEENLLDVVKMSHRIKSQSQNSPMEWHESDQSGLGEPPNSLQSSLRNSNGTKRVAPEPDNYTTPTKRRPRIDYIPRVLFPPKSAEKEAIVEASNSSAIPSNQNMTPKRMRTIVPNESNANREQILSDNFDLVSDYEEDQENSSGVLNAPDASAEGEEKLIFQKYFKIVGAGSGKNVLASCNECGENKRGSLVATTNFKRHLKVNFYEISGNRNFKFFNMVPDCSS